MSRIYVIFHDCLLSYTTVCYIRFSSVGLNRLKNELLAEYLKKITVGQSCEYQRPVAMLSNNSFQMQIQYVVRKYGLSVAVLQNRPAEQENHVSHLRVAMPARCPLCRFVTGI